MNNKEKMFPESNKYKEKLEIKYLVRQNIFVLTLISLIGLLSVFYLIILDFEIRMILGLSSGFIVIIIFNIASLSYGHYQIEFLKFNKFITSISFFTLIIIYVLYFKSPSIIPFLFLGYLIAAIYKDIKVLMVISLYFILTITMLLMNYHEIFDFTGNSSTSYFVIGLFVFLFLSLLMISTYITLKESQFFYNQISFTKEKELRNLQLLVDLKDQIDVEKFDSLLYCERVNNFFEEFSMKLNINNVFKAKIDAIYKLSQGVKKKEILDEYKDLTMIDLNRLEAFVIDKDSVIRKMAMRIYYYNQKEIHQREIFSETHFESLNKSTDDIEIKIMTFTILYVMLKNGLPGTKQMSKEEIYHTIIDTEFFYFLHPAIRQIYQDNSEVFEVIFNDAFNGVVS